MYVSAEVAEIINKAFSMAGSAGFEYVTPELVLYAACGNRVFSQAFENCGGEIRILDRDIRTYLEEYLEKRPEESTEAPVLSRGAEYMLTRAWEAAANSEKSVVELPHVIYAVYELEESYAAYYMRLQGVERIELLQEMSIIREETAEEEEDSGLPEEESDREENRSGLRRRNGGSRKKREPGGHGRRKDGQGKEDRPREDGQEEEWLQEDGQEEEDRPQEDGQEQDWLRENEQEEQEEDDQPRGEDRQEEAGPKGKRGFWRQYAVCLNEEVEHAKPLIGRGEELERTMQILCRREKNNPLHIGEPGVGKTAITYGLARLLNEGRVPEPLKGAKIYSLDLGSLLAGTQYRGDFEKRFKRVMDSISREENPIIYIDEIHNIVGAGAVNGGNFDITNMLKPYLAAGHVRFIGATTYEEYRKHFEKSKSLIRRFQNIDIPEPDTQDAVLILEGLRSGFEEFHGVRYEEGVLSYAVEMSAKYQNDRYLPDKAIDLMDEAGAYRRMHPLAADTQSVDRELIDDILSRICHIPKQAVESEETQSLATLEERLRKRIYGQDEAIAQVVNAVKFSRAGLLEEGKPLANLLFVGPTGVGKTEIARSLAEELGIRLIRFDMSEYEEKHAVAKLIGAPAGYVGYEEGGLLTEEVRRHPHAVLLLDEIEKAHPDIYNVLLQAMDYATLTDNQGRKADFRNVIIIMTSNAGASRIGKPQIGFQGEDRSADVVMEEVKRIFQPEFRNRLNRIVVFRGMDGKMAQQIVVKKLGELQVLLSRKNVEMSADEEAKKLVEKKGISPEFGAREIERVIQGEIKPLLVDEILFGALKEGGKCHLTVREGAFRIVMEK